MPDFKTRWNVFIYSLSLFYSSAIGTLIKIPCTFSVRLLYYSKFLAERTFFYSMSFVFCILYFL